MKKRSTNIHHVYPRSRGGLNEPENLERVPANLHQWFHAFFENDTPHEQIFRLLEWDSKVILEPTLQMIFKLIEQQLGNNFFYKSNVKK